MRIIYDDTIKKHYENLWDTMVVHQSMLIQTSKLVDRMFKYRDRYLAVEMATRCPKEVIMVIHAMEASLDFSCHLANGDSLKYKTISVPVGLPVTDHPGPYTWEEGAIAAINYDKMNRTKLGDISYLLYRLEGFNGYGYLKMNLNSPYLWSGSNHYVKGKFVKDHQYDPNFISRQIGAAILLKSVMLEESDFLKRTRSKSYQPPRASEN